MKVSVPDRLRHKTDFRIPVSSLSYLEVPIFIVRADGDAIFRPGRGPAGLRQRIPGPAPVNLCIGGIGRDTGFYCLQFEGDSSLRFPIRSANDFRGEIPGHDRLVAPGLPLVAYRVARTERLPFAVRQLG